MTLYLHFDLFWPICKREAPHFHENKYHPFLGVLKGQTEVGIRVPSKKGASTQKTQATLRTSKLGVLHCLTLKHYGI